MFIIKKNLFFLNPSFIYRSLPIEWSDELIKLVQNEEYC